MNYKGIDLDQMEYNTLYGKSPSRDRDGVVKKKRKAPIIRNAADLEAFGKQMYETGPKAFYNRMAGNKESHWFVFGTTLDGKPVVFGPEDSEVAAMQRGSQLDAVEAFELPTRDLGRATRHIKAILMGRGKSPDKVLTPYGHKRRLL